MWAKRLSLSSLGATERLQLWDMSRRSKDRQNKRRDDPVFILTTLGRPYGTL
jgi:hypothetical protein